MQIHMPCAKLPKVFFKHFPSVCRILDFVFDSSCMQLAGHKEGVNWHKNVPFKKWLKAQYHPFVPAAG